MRRSMNAVEEALLLADEIEGAMDQQARHIPWADGPWEHLGDAHRDVRVLIAGLRLAASKPSVRNEECGSLKQEFGGDGQMICRGPAGHDGGHVWERDASGGGRWRG